MATDPARYPERPPPTVDPTTLTIEMVNRELVNLRSMLDAEVGHLKELFTEKIISTEHARSVALEGVTKANDKLEARFSKQIEDMGDLFTSKIEGINKRLDESLSSDKTREGRNQGIGMTLGGIVQLITTIVGVATIVIALFVSFHK
jgi:hypothetical protein